jgi:microcystin-dependent protein
MAEPFIGEVRIVSFNFPPKGWALCNGQFLPINQNQALFSILGTTYGGNGTTNFALPNMQGRVPAHPGASLVLGESGGAEGIALTTAQIPSHNHLQQGSVNQATTVTPSGNVFAAKARRGADAYAPPPATTAINSQDATGSNEPHENRQPSLVLNFVIAVVGIFPSRN